MDKPKITYHILDSTDSYIQKYNTYMGTYTGDEPLTVNFRIWNNFRGTTDVADLGNFNLVVRFLAAEDNMLLQYISLSVTNDIEIPCVVEDNALVGTFFQPVTLSGQANTGADEYTANYINITVTFDAPGIYLKDHDLKSMVLDIAEI